MNTKKHAVKGILIPLIIIFTLMAALVLASTTFAAEKAATDTYGWIYVKKAVEWNGATPDTEKEFEICVTKLPDTDMGCQVFTYQDVLDQTEKAWYFSSTGTYVVWEKDPGIEWEWTVSGGSEIVVIPGDISFHKTVTNTTRALDYGDLPDAYGLTLLSEDGPRHEKGDLFLGGPPDGGITIEDDGQPEPSALGDLNDDGIVPLGNWSNGSGSLQVSVTGGDGCLFGWMDYKDRNDASGSNLVFEADETLLYNYVISEGPTVIPIGEFTYSIDSDAIQGSNAYSRFRLLPQQENGACEYGEFRPPSTGDPLDMLMGAYVNGEVEDYFWPFQTNTVSMLGFSASSQQTPTLLIAGIALLILASLSTFVWRRRHMVVV